MHALRSWLEEAFLAERSPRFGCAHCGAPKTAPGAGPGAEAAVAAQA